jgi:hypothetical protein
MGRVRVRVSSGVFEVTLVKVFEEEHGIEVLWTDGHVCLPSILQFAHLILIPGQSEC